MVRYNFRWSPTKFGSGVAKLLDKESALELIKNELGGTYELNVDQNNLKFKTPSFKYFKNLNEDDMERIRMYSHLITVNYGRNPIWLLWLTTISGVQYSFYVNLVTQQIIWSGHRFAPWLYEGTVMEGELLNMNEVGSSSNGSGPEFVIWELVIHKGKWYSGNLWAKLAIMKEIHIHHYQQDSVIENVNLRIRPHVTYEYLKSFVTDVLANDRNAQGILFIPVDKSVKYYSLLFRFTDQIQLKKDMKMMSEVELNPVKIVIEELSKDDGFRNQDQVFWLGLDRGIYDNYYLHSINRDGVVVQHELAMIRSLEQSQWVKEMFKKHAGRMEGGIGPLLKFQCQFVKRFQKWEPIKLLK